MSIHVQITLFLFFLNSMFFFYFPDSTFLDSDNQFFSYDDQTQTYNIDGMVAYDTVEGSISSESTSVMDSTGVYDIFMMVIDFFRWLLSFLFGFFIFISSSSLEFPVKLLLFVPMLILYLYSFIASVRGLSS